MRGSKGVGHRSDPNTLANEKALKDMSVFGQTEVIWSVR